MSRKCKISGKKTSFRTQGFKVPHQNKELAEAKYSVKENLRSLSLGAWYDSVFPLGQFAPLPESVSRHIYARRGLRSRSTVEPPFWREERGGGAMLVGA